MQLKTFRISITSPEQSEGEVNAFLRAHRILSAERHFCPDLGGYWAILVEYAEDGHADCARPARRRERTSVADELNEAEKVRFERYRKIRYDVSVERGVPAYAVFTDRELAILSRLEELNLEGVKSLKGIAPSHLEDNLHYLLEGVTDETSREPDGADSAS